MEENLTLRETIRRFATPTRSAFVGVAQTIADEMERWQAEGAVDGFNLIVRTPSQLARFIDEVLPILRERGVARAYYDTTTLRGHLGIPVPENRYTTRRRQQESAASQH